jgi:hypothetical protein
MTGINVTCSDLTVYSTDSEIIARYDVLSYTLFIGKIVVKYFGVYNSHGFFPEIRNSPDTDILVRISLYMSVKLQESYP